MQNFKKSEMATTLRNDKRRIAMELDTARRVKRVSTLYATRTESMLKQGLADVLVKPTQLYIVSENSIKGIKKEFDKIRNEANDNDGNLQIIEPKSYERNMFKPIFDNFTLKNILLAKQQTCNICTEPLTFETIAVLECEHIKCRDCIREIIETKSVNTPIETLNRNGKEIKFLCSFCNTANHTFTIIGRSSGKLMHGHFEKNNITGQIELRHSYTHTTR